MATLGMESSCWSNRYSAPALHLAESYCVGAPGDLILPTITSPTSRRPRQRADVERQRPLTFHEGFLRTSHDEDAMALENDAGLFVADDAAVSQYISGPTIASIRCDEDASLPTPTFKEQSSPPPTPTLRLDTTCAPAISSTSSLALVSDFLGTLAGLVHSPLTPSTSQPTRSDNAIMIFDSDVFVDMGTDHRHSWFDGFNLPTPSPWAAPSMDWEFLAPFSVPRKGPSESLDHLDPVSAVAQERDVMDATGLVWC